MEEASRQRKERLEATRKRKLEASKSEEQTVDDQDSNTVKKPVLKFRNYTPTNEEIKAAAKVHIATPNDLDETLEKHVDQITKEVEEAEKAKREEEVDLFNLAPKKPNWDLKRDVEKKLTKLERKTQASIARLIKARLQNESIENTSVGLVDAVNAQHKADLDDNDSD
ncbi:2219_t:CDS:2 [Scutellospora calospora]|uniref:2219_t:CDS:1 n=1 Tax=Scutellospora calospora TaxID=85575 RepID=A0ACA9MX42_9GLOM|nr:2219_t:CDS:2 [Scutellospora calospora]